jgi:hypothetical protein
LLCGGSDASDGKNSQTYTERRAAKRDISADEDLKHLTGLQECSVALVFAW